jgi:signal peptidase II
MNIKVATLFAETSSGDLFGTVADMFYFLRWQGTLSEWIPLIGGDFFTFFQYIYADAFISVDVAFFLSLF